MLSNLEVILKDHKPPT